MTEQLKAPAVEDAQGASERVLTEVVAHIEKLIERAEAKIKKSKEFTP